MNTVFLFGKGESKFSAFWDSHNL